MEQLAYLIKKDNKYCLGVFTDDKSAHRGNRHEKILIQPLSTRDAAHRFPEHVPADDPIGDEKGKQPQPALQGGGPRSNQQDGGDEDTQKYLFLLPVHGGTSADNDTVRLNFAANLYRLLDNFFKACVVGDKG